MAISADLQADALRDALGTSSVHLHSRGGESRTFSLHAGDQLVTVGLDWPRARRDESDLEREASLLRRVGEHVGVRVPEVVSVVPAAGVLVMRRMPGARLIDVADRTSNLALEAARVVGRTLAELHTSPPALYERYVPLDATEPWEWREDAAEHARTVAGSLDPGKRAAVRAFLARPAPPSCEELRFTHNDLGIEHVLVDAHDELVTGIIDWSDAAITDPAVDLGRLLRDLGPSALEEATRTYAAHGGQPDELMSRVPFYAACGILEDLAFGLTHARPEYTAKCASTWDAVLGLVA